MSTESLDKVVALNKLADKVEKFWPSYREAIAPSEITRYNASFGDGGQGYVAFECLVKFSAYTGYHGSSKMEKAGLPRTDCNVFGDLSSDELRPYFVGALNSLRHEIFDEMAKLIKAEANKEAVKAEKELRMFRDALSKARGGKSDDI